MKSSYRRSSSKGVRGLAFATIVVVIVLVIDMASDGWIRGGVRNSSVSVWRFGSQKIGNVFQGEFFSSRRALREENAALRAEIARLTLRTAAVTMLEEEISSLRAITRLVEADFGITAPVVSSFRSSPYGTFMIGAGADDGVSVGSLVLASEGGHAGFVIGRVSEAGARTSLVMQIFAPHVETEATLRGAALVVEGRGSGNARTQVPAELPVEVGDAVVSAEFRGRAIGLVGAVSSDPASVSKEIYIRLPINLSTLKFVYVAH